MTKLIIIILLALNLSASNEINYLLDDIKYKINNSDINNQTKYNTKKKLQKILEELTKKENEIKIDDVFLFDDR